MISPDIVIITRQELEDIIYRATCVESARNKALIEERDDLQYRLDRLSRKVGAERE